MTPFVALQNNNAIRTRVLKESRHNFHHHIERDGDVNVHYHVPRTRLETARSKIENEKSMSCLLTIISE